MIINNSQSDTYNMYLSNYHFNVYSYSHYIIMMVNILVFASINGVLIQGVNDVFSAVKLK